MVKIVKVGPAFFDFISADQIKIRRNSSTSFPQELFVYLPFFILLAAFLVIGLRLFYIQVLRGDYYKRLADENRTKTLSIAAPRGIIYDRKNRPLVSNSSVFRKEILGKSKIIGRDEALMLMSKKEKVESEVRREYPHKEAFTHVLGYVGQVTEEDLAKKDFGDYGFFDYVGKSGLEAQYEKLLHGKNGKSLFEVDSQGTVIRELGKKEPVAGTSIKTTLDLDIEIAAESAMKDVERGAVVVSDPRDGAILALFSKPTFDPNIFIQEENYAGDSEYKTIESILDDQEKQPLLNRAIAGLYPPGSTFKLITAIAALSEGAIKPTTLIEDTGILRVGDFSFGNWYFLQYGKTEGALDVVSAIKRSNDIFFYKAAEAAGVENISSFAAQLGLGERFGIDLDGEEKGTVPSPSWKEKNIGEQWYLGDTYNYGIGQGYLLTTPLQVNMFTSVFANGGTLYKPHLIINHKSPARNATHSVAGGEIINHKFIDKKNIDLVREGMRQTCDTGGVAWPFFQFRIKNSELRIDGKDFTHEASDSANTVRIKVACKTGTAEVGDKETKPHSWITVFAPFYKPEIVVTVLVENGGEGSSVAGPIAKKILQDYFERK